jgi:maltose alpha-D-glucosyltransferase/alpha-amylase
MLTLPAYGFFWFLLAAEADAPRWHAPAPDPLPEFVTLTAPGGKLDKALEGRERQQLEKDVLPEFLSRQRWFAGKGAKMTRVGVTPVGSIPGFPNELLFLNAEISTPGEHRYFMPVTAMWGEENLRFGAPKLSYTMAKLRYGPNLGALIDGSFDERFHQNVVDAMLAGTDVAVEDGIIRFTASDNFRALTLGPEIRSVGVEQSNVSFVIGEAAMLKVYRRLRRGEQPEIEVARFLTEVAGYRNAPAFFGDAEYVPAKGEPVTLAAAFAFVRNQGDAWGAILEALDRHLEHAALQHHEEADGSVAPETFAHPLDIGTVLGRRTAELHAAFATPTDDKAFAAEAIRATDVKRWAGEALREAKAALALVAKRARSLPENSRQDVAALIAAKSKMVDRLSRLQDMPATGLKTRIHGDFHLGQVLIAQDPVVLIDFEGEPARGLATRRQKTSPLRDVAGMLRSFDYAAWSSIDHMQTRHEHLSAEIRIRALEWRDTAIKDFLSAYWPIAKQAGVIPKDIKVRNGLLDLFLIQKAAYEIAYEAANRPGWLSIPVRGLLALVAPRTGES